VQRAGREFLLDDRGIGMDPAGDCHRHTGKAHPGD
jgi:hypothetical protein